MPEGGGITAPAEEMDLRGLPKEVTAEEEEEEEKATWGLWTGVRGGPSEPGSGLEEVVDVVSHLGGITDCLGGNGSRSVSRTTSESGE